MITKDEFSSFPWINAPVLGTKLKRKKDILSFYITIYSDKKYKLSFKDCVLVNINQYGYFIGHDTILDINYSSSTSLVMNEKENSFNKEEELIEITITCNSGSSYSILINQNTKMKIK